MNALRVKNSYKIVSTFIENGGDVFIDDGFNYIFSSYYDFLIDKKQSEFTLTRKLQSTYIFLCFIKDCSLTLSMLTRNTAYIYVSLLSSYGWSLRYIDYHKLYLRMFLNWSFDKNYSSFSGNTAFPRIIIHKNTSIRTYYTIEEINLLLQAVDTTTTQGKEDFLILSIICFLGLRISDVIHLKLSNFDFINSTVSLKQYKTKTQIVLPLINQVKYPLLDFLKNVRPKDSTIDYIFITTTPPYRHRLELKTHHHIVKKYLRIAGIEIDNRKAGFHALRHSFSTSLLANAIPLYSISKILGHTAIDTTMDYLDINTLKLKLLALEVPYVTLL